MSGLEALKLPATPSSRHVYRKVLAGQKEAQSMSVQNMGSTRTGFTVDQNEPITKLCILSKPGHL